MRRLDEAGNDGEWVLDTTDAGPVQQRLVGIGLAAIIAACAIYVFATGQAIVPGSTTSDVASDLQRIVWVRVHGFSALALGFIVLSIAGFIHLHWYWTASTRFWAYAQLGKIIASVGAAAGLAALIYALLTSSDVERLDAPGTVISSQQ